MLNKYKPIKGNNPKNATDIYTVTDTPPETFQTLNIFKGEETFTITGTAPTTCYIHCNTVETAKEIRSFLLSQKLVKYACFVKLAEEVKVVNKPEVLDLDSYDQVMPEGFRIVEGFVEGDDVLKCILDEEIVSNKVRTVHYGPGDFVRCNGGVGSNLYYEGEVDCCCGVCERVESDFGFKCDQVTYDLVEKGWGMRGALIKHSMWEEDVVYVVLGSALMFTFADKKEGSKKKYHILIHPGSAIYIGHEMRYSWAIGVKRGKHDMINGEKVQRNTAVVLTMRTYNAAYSCTCEYDALCNGKKKSKLEAIPLDEYKNMDTETLVNRHVKDVYNEIAVHWDLTRHSPWRQVKKYITELPEGTFLGDIGCGNGKYLGTNKDIITLGCDLSFRLVEICKEKGFDVFIADATNLPIHSNTFDAVINIAVMHHIPTYETRKSLLSELLRVIKPGGQVYICAWAQEQEDHSRRRFPSQDVMVPWERQEKFGGEVFYRYCHVYVQGELEAIFEDIGNNEIVKSFYDSSNWCVIVKKL